MKAQYYVGILTFLLLLCGTFIDTRASCTATGCTSKIREIYPTGMSDGRVYIKPDETSLSALNCTPPEGLFLTLHHSHPNYTELFAVANLAFALNKTIYLRVVEGSGDCTINYIKLY